MTNDPMSNYVDITYTYDEIHAFSKLICKVRNPNWTKDFSELFKDDDLRSFIDKTANYDVLWDEEDDD